MARNSQLAGALLGSLLLHGAILALPSYPAGAAKSVAPAARWAFVVTAAAGDTDVQSAPEARPIVVIPEPVPSVAMLPPTEQTAQLRQSLSAREAPGKDTIGAPGSGIGTTALAIPLLDLDRTVYYQVSEVSRPPVLRVPVLQEEAGRLYPVSQTYLSVRINETGGVDTVLLLRGNHADMAAEAIAAFEKARYFPAKMGSKPVKVELLIEVRSSVDKMVVTPMER